MSRGDFAVSEGDKSGYKLRATPWEHRRPLDWTRRDGSIVITLPSRISGLGGDHPFVIAADR
ncbi:hypothetical protein NE236_30880 [Actinoallomurus purpureus]|uniref:hypothetical protein n=1 Tax=Actinoallomurus purpureus TaxID=478114 RepID=UPI002092F9F9|nr:hypothetical protein [Actinoallomurus purpureus]MCO6009386.1 hypothetical protein [Actinoallomurus purpureus]